MHIRPVLTALTAAATHASAVGGADPAVDAALTQLVEALGPALRVAAMELVEQAAGEVRAQLPDHRVDIVLEGGDPSLRISEGPQRETPRSASEDFDARISLRLPPSLKQLIEDAAGNNGESVNGWIVEALGKRAQRPKPGGKTVTEGFDL